MKRLSKKTVLVTSFVFLSLLGGCFFDGEEEYYTEVSINDNKTQSKEISPFYKDKILEYLTEKE